MGRNLRSGNTQSCGCIKSFGEVIVSRILTENNIEFKREYIFSDLKGTGGGPLRFDFAVFKNNELSYLIEFDGIQHYDKNNPYYSEANVANDKRKNKYCAAHNIPLIRLRDYKDLTIEDLLLK